MGLFASVLLYVGGEGNLSKLSAELGFLELATREDLAKWLGISDKQLRYLLYKLPSSKKYTSFSIPKKSGGSRQIAAPISFLLGLQKKIAHSLYLHSPPRLVAKGYVKGRSILDHGELHAGRRWVICADIQDFYPSINFGRVVGMFRSPPFSFGDPVAVPLAQLCCLDGVLPQGAPRSPVVSNIVCR